jgi:hypothetical protein
MGRALLHGATLGEKVMLRPELLAEDIENPVIHRLVAEQSGALADI